MTDPQNFSANPSSSRNSTQSHVEHESLDMLTQAAAVVLSMVNIQGPPTLTPLAGGGNNRVFRVDVPKGSLVLKAYFQHPDDSRDRLDAEFSFLKHVWNMGIRNIPQPVARLPLRQLGLYTFIHGKRFTPGSVTQDHVAQAASFVHTINTNRNGFAGQSNAPDLITEDRPVVAHASDACFTLAHHLGSIEQRLSRVIALPGKTDIDKQAVAFAQGDLTAVWKKLVSRFRSQVERAKLDLHQPVDEGDRVLSPSDFGFHNAVLQEVNAAQANDSPTDQVAFLDCEYAGWDDPAKLICDFFTQIAVPVPIEHLTMFTDTFTSCLHSAADVIQRVELLLPLYKIKWCAMALGDFSPVSAKRRAFAKQKQTTSDETQSDTQIESHKAAQLQKARTLLADIH